MTVFFNSNSTLLKVSERGYDIMFAQGETNGETRWGDVAATMVDNPARKINITRYTKDI